MKSRKLTFENLGSRNLMAADLMGGYCGFSAGDDVAVTIDHTHIDIPFDDVAFRRALAHCIPKERIVEEFYEGYAVAAHSTVGPMNKFWHNPKSKTIIFSLEKAREILKEAGYEWDSKGKLYYPK